MLYALALLLFVGGIGRERAGKRQLLDIAPDLVTGIRPRLLQIAGALRGSVVALAACVRFEQTGRSTSFAHRASGYGIGTCIYAHQARRNPALGIARRATWKTFFARSRPTVASCIMEGSVTLPPVAL